MFDFDSQYQNLNQQQKYVVDELDRNILLLAAAGTGKTNTLALRIVKLLREGRAAPEQVLCLTFTNRACKEMKERIVSAVGPEGLKIEVRTFHSFCYELIQAFVKTTDLPSGFVIYDEDDCRELLGGFDLSLMGKGSIAAVQKFIDHIKEQRLLLPGRSNAAVIKHCYDNHYDKLEATCKERGSGQSCSSCTTAPLPSGTPLILTTCSAKRLKFSPTRNTLLVLQKATNLYTSTRCRTQA